MYLKNLEVYLDSGIAGSRYSNHVIEKRFLFTSLLLLLPSFWGRGARLPYSVKSVFSSSRFTSYHCAASTQTVSAKSLALTHWPILGHVLISLEGWNALIG